MAAQQLPRGCAQGIATDSINCFSRVIPQPGNYQLIIRAARKLVWREGTECSPTDDCECRPDANGACTNTNVSARYSTDLVFTLPTSNYFQSQTFEISAP